MEKVKVIVYGVGVVGGGVVRIIANKEWMEIVGAIDVDKRKVGKDLGEVARIGKRLGVIVSDNPSAVFSKIKADIVLHATSFTTTEETKNQVLMAIESGSNVISTTDTKLSYPWRHWPELGQEIDEAAKKKGVTFLYTGINPAFAMNLVPLVATGICGCVKRVMMKRVVDSAPYGEGVLKVLGIGRTVDSFHQGLEDGSIGGVAPPEAPQIDMIADTLGWRVEQERTVTPLISEKRKVTSYGEVLEPGVVCGTTYTYRGLEAEVEKITFDFVVMMKAAEEDMEPGNYVSIVGDQNVEVTLKASSTEISASAPLVNAIPQVISAGPGLLTVRDLPIATVLKQGSRDEAD